MIINIDTFTALQHGLSLNEMALLDCMANLIEQPAGATFDHDGQTYKWLSAGLILNSLAIISFQSERQLANVINKIVTKGLLLKKRILGKPCYAVAPLYRRKSISTEEKPVTDCENCVANVEKCSATAPKPDSSVSKPNATPSKRNATQPKPSADYTTTNQDKNVSKNNSDKGNSSNHVPTLAEVEDYAKRQGWGGFTAEKFLEYNVGRNWKGVKDWHEAAERWNAQAIAYNNKPLTYQELVNKCTARLAQWSDYELNKSDGRWYRKKKKGNA